MYKVTPKSYTYANGKITFTDSTEDKDDLQLVAGMYDYTIKAAEALGVDADGYEKDNKLTLNGAEVNFTNNKYTIKNAVKGTEYVFTSK